MSLRQLAPRVGAGLLVLTGPLVGAAAARLAAVPEAAPTPAATIAPSDGPSVTVEYGTPEDGGRADAGSEDAAADRQAAGTRRRRGVQADSAGEGAQPPQGLGRGTAPGGTAALPPPPADDRADGDSATGAPAALPEDVERLVERRALSPTDRLILDRLRERGRLGLLSAPER